MELSLAFAKGCVLYEDKGAHMTESIITLGILVGNIINKSNCIVGFQFPMPNAGFQQLNQLLLCTNTCVSDAWCSHGRMMLKFFNNM